jgi:hypothetical protein
MFFDRIRTDFLGGSSNNPPFVANANVFDGNIDNPAGATQRSFPPNLSGLFLGLRTPRVMTFNFGIQREITEGVVAEVGYVGTLGRNQERTLNINQLPAGTRLNPPNSAINANALRLYQGYANITLRDTGDNTNYNALQASLNQRFRSGLSFGVNYTWSKTFETSSGSFEDIFNTSRDYALSSIHRAHVLAVNYVYELPFFRNSNSSTARVALSGWQISGIVQYQSGAPNSVSVPVDVARIGVGSSRASVTGNPILPSSERTLARWFNTEAFLPPNLMVQGQFGNSGRNIIIGPSYSQWDIALMKNFRLQERTTLQFRAESFNFPNHPSFTSINTTVRFDAQGRPIQNYGAVTGAGPARVLEFGLKLIF